MTRRLGQLDVPDVFRCSYYASLCGFSQQSSEGDNRGHAGAVQEQERGQTLQAERICEIWQEVWSLPLHIQKQSTKKPDKKHQTQDYCRLSCERGGRLQCYAPRRMTCKINTHQAISFHQAILFITIISKTIITIMQKTIWLLFKFDFL